MKMEIEKLQEIITTTMKKLRDKGGLGVINRGAFSGFLNVFKNSQSEYGPNTIILVDRYFFLDKCESSKVSVNDLSDADVQKIKALMEAADKDSDKFDEKEYKEYEERLKNSLKEVDILTYEDNVGNKNHIIEFDKIDDAQITRMANSYAHFILVYFSALAYVFEGLYSIDIHISQSDDLDYVDIVANLVTGVEKWKSAFMLERNIELDTNC